MPWIKQAPQMHICPIPFKERSTFGDVWECDEYKSHWERVDHDDNRLYEFHVRVMHNKYFIQTIRRL